MDAASTALWAVALAVSVVGAIALLVWRTPTASHDPRPLVGTLASVIVRVPSHGIGRITYAAHGKRCSMPAKSIEQEPLSVGTEVAVVAAERGVAVVAPI